MLFVLAIDPLQRILQLSTEQGLLKPTQSRSTRIRISLYADDTAIFTNPSSSDLQTLRTILNAFGEASDLKANLDKTMVYPILCNDLNLVETLLSFPAKVHNFSMHLLRSATTYPKALQPLIDKVVEEYWHKEVS